MRFYTTEECEEWLRERKRLKPDDAPESHTKVDGNLAGVREEWRTSI
jgi:hypothetical protein